MLYANSPEPLYKQLYHKLRDAIEDGAYEVGHQLPSERRLAAEHGISRLTARKAINLLRQEGYVTAYQGRGSFVAKSQPDEIQPVLLKSFTEVMHEQGKVPSTKVLDFRVVTTDEEIASKLKLKPGDKAIMIRRLRFGDGQPVAVDTTYLRYDLCVNILRMDLEDASLYDILENTLNLQLHHAKQTIEATLGSRKMIALLDLPVPAAVMQMKRQTFDDQGRVIEYSSVIYRGDRYNVNLPVRRINSRDVSALDAA
jgi:GntR family transcriptional regulator